MFYITFYSNLDIVIVGQCVYIFSPQVLILTPTVRPRARCLSNFFSLGWMFINLGNTIVWIKLKIKRVLMNLCSSGVFIKIALSVTLEKRGVSTG